VLLRRREPIVSSAVWHARDVARHPLWLRPHDLWAVEESLRGGIPKRAGTHA